MARTCQDRQLSKSDTICLAQSEILRATHCEAGSLSDIRPIDVDRREGGRSAASHSLADELRSVCLGMRLLNRIYAINNQQMSQQ